MADDDENIQVDWGKESFGASVPTLEHCLNKYKPNFKGKLIDKVYKSAKNDIFSFSEYKKNIFDSSVKKYGIFQKIVGKTSTLFTVRGFGVGFLDVAFLGKDLIDVYNSDSSRGDKIYNAGKKISGSLGGIIAGGIVGAKLGTIFGPVGTFVGSIVGSIVGGFLGEQIYDSINDIIKCFSGTSGSFRSGGIEFIYPKEIREFKNNFIFNKFNYIAFEYDDKKFNLNSVINLVNSKFLIGNIKAKNMNQIYDTILQEIAYGFLYKKNYQKSL